MLLYLPIGFWAYLAAASDGVLNFATVVLSVVIGAVAMASAIVLLAIQPRLRYPDVDPTPPTQTPEAVQFPRARSASGAAVTLKPARTRSRVTRPRCSRYRVSNAPGVSEGRDLKHSDQDRRLL